MRKLKPSARRRKTRRAQPVCHARTVLHPRPHAALHRGHHRRRAEARGRGGAGPQSRALRQGIEDFAESRNLHQPRPAGRKESRLNEAFRHWIVHRTPFVTVKAAMSLDGKIATRAGQSKWITGPEARAYGMTLRAGADAILVGVNTIVTDDPSLTLRQPGFEDKRLRRIVLDPTGRIPLRSKVIADKFAAWTTVVVTRAVPPRRLTALRRRVRVLQAPARNGGIDLPWLLRSWAGNKSPACWSKAAGKPTPRFCCSIWPTAWPSFTRRWSWADATPPKPWPAGACPTWRIELFCTMSNGAGWGGICS